MDNFRIHNRNIIAKELIMLEIFFGALVALLANSQYSYDDCKLSKFEGKQCKVQKFFHSKSKK